MEKIINAIERSGESGRMSDADIKTLFSMMNKLYNYLYGDYPNFKETTMMVDDMLLTHEEEAELRRSMTIAQKLIKEGWDFEKVARTVELDVSTVESLYTMQTQT